MNPFSRHRVSFHTMRPSSTRAVLALASLLSVVVPFTLAAQVTTVDEGSFTITKNGQPHAREEFSIRRAQSADSSASFVASATITYGDRRVTPALRTDPRGAPLAYQVESKLGTTLEERLSGQVGRGRFSARIRTPRGESAREYVVADGALILDEEVFHQYFFLARVPAGVIPVVVPRRNIQISARVESRGTESLVMGGRTIEARMLALIEPNAEPRIVWVDSAGRVLKVSVPSRGLIAVRDDPPK